MPQQRSKQPRSWRQLPLAFLNDLLTRERLKARIRRNSVVDPETGCWRWTGKKTKARGGAGYPRITIRIPGYRTPRSLVATRVSLEVFVGPPPHGHEAAHDPECCPYTDCVNWAHLRWATRKENELDKRHPKRLTHIREVHPPVHRIFAPAVDPEEIPF